jgi:NADP-dependent 3-hydroxy acid dehydrogenase YdfG
MQKRVIVITGASAGIGAAAAEQLGTAGHALVLVARRADALAEVAARSGRDVETVVADVTSRAEVRRAVQAALARFGRIDVWINNVGRGITRLPTQLTDEDVDLMMQVNVKSVLYGMQEVLPHFRERGTGHIINVSSMLGRLPINLARSAYTASKHYLNALTAMVREEVRADHPGIQVSLVSPGVVWTGFGLAAVHGGDDSRSIPDGQTPEAVAAVIARIVETRQPDVYTRPGMRARVASYYDAVGVDPD